MPLSALDITRVQRSILALKRYEWFRIHGGPCPQLDLSHGTYCLLSCFF